MNPIELIKTKRDGFPLSRNQIDFFIKNYLHGYITDYQMSAMLMAIYFNGMNDEETFHLTEIMLHSGVVVDLMYLNMPKVDKHSTGGVGDKTSLILAPLVAACGIAVPMISGRGLGHTGGTLDKLESIPGFKVNFSIQDFKRIIAEVGVVLIGQTSELAPADKKLYALRDVTGTVDSIPLITSSIMSKKLAEGADAIVFDVKVGNGANLPGYERALELAKKLISVSKKFDKKAIAVLTDMEQPLGRKIGNWLEVEECIELMNGAIVPDLYKVTNVLAGAMIYLGGKVSSIDEGEELAKEKLMDKSAYKKFLEIVSIQNGNVNYIEDWENYKRAGHSKTIVAVEDGFVSELSALDFGFVSIELGSGRKKVDDKIDNLAGIILKKKYGDEVRKGETICELYSESEHKLLAGVKRLEGAVQVSKHKPEQRNLIIEILQ